MKEIPFISYIDPGTGGMIAGSLWSFITATLVAIAGFIPAYFIRPLKKFLLRAVRNKGFLPAAILIIISGIIIANLSGEKQMTNKVIVVGIDAMDPKIVDKLMAEDKLPNLNE